MILPLVIKLTEVQDTQFQRVYRFIPYLTLSKRCFLEIVRTYNFNYRKGERGISILRRLSKRVDNNDRRFSNRGTSKWDSLSLDSQRWLNQAATKLRKK